MANPKNSTGTLRVKVKVSRKGVHSKKNNSKNKVSKKYRKAYVGQG